MWRSLFLGFGVSLVLPEQSRFTLNEDAHIESAIKKELEPLQREISELRSSLNPEFRQTNSNQKATGEGKSTGQSDWRGLGVPEKLISSLEDLVESFKNRESHNSELTPEKVSAMIASALRNGPPMQPDLMARMFENWRQQQNSMTYLQQSQPRWIQTDPRWPPQTDIMRASEPTRWVQNALPSEPSVVPIVPGMGMTLRDLPANSYLSR